MYNNKTPLLGKIEKNLTVSFLIILICIIGCQRKSLVEPQIPPLQVYDGQYITELGAALDWCGGPFWDDGECMAEAHGESYLVTPIGDNLAIIRKGFDVGSKVLPLAAKVTDYKQNQDLCFSDFPDDPCSPNYLITTELNDPLFSQQWGLQNIKAEQAWTMAPISTVAVAVIDTGVDCSHPEIYCIGEYNAITGRAGPGSAMDDNGHGTHVASTIGSYCGNSEGICGVAPSAPILACKFLGKSGGGSLQDAIECIIWAREQGAKIINASWGCTGCYSEPLLSSIKLSRDNGLLVFAAAAGNSGLNNDDQPHYPSSYVMQGYDPIISVGAIDEQNKRARFSNYGNDSVDIEAPGVAIIAGWTGGGYNKISGTSMAAPHVAGAASLLIFKGSQEPKSNILSTMVKGSDANGVRESRLDLEAAMQKVMGIIPCQAKRLKKCKKRCRKKFGKKTPRTRKCRRRCKAKYCPQS